MPDITFPTTEYNNIADGSVANGSDIMTLLYDTSANDTSLFMCLNGNVSAPNFKSTFKVHRRHIQRGAMAESDKSSGTANLDYWYHWFQGMSLEAGDWEGGLDELGPDVPHLAIPGACRSFYCKWSCLVELTWTIYTTYAEYGPDTTKDKLSGLFLKVDGEYSEAQFQPGGYQAELYYDPRREKCRVWSGHTLIELDRGWHDAGICITSDEIIRSTRVHACSINVRKLRPW